MNPMPSRRVFLGGLVAAGGASLAGCRQETYLTPNNNSRIKDLNVSSRMKFYHEKN